MNRTARLLIPLFALLTGCFEQTVRMYIEVDKSCVSCCEGLQFKVIYDNVENGVLSAGDRVRIDKAIGDNGRLFITVHNDNEVDNHPLRCQKCVSSKINIQEWTPTPEDQVYVYYNQLIYFQNRDINVTVTCEPLPVEPPGICDDVYCWEPPDNECIANNVISRKEPRGVCVEGECVYPEVMDLCAQSWCYETQCGSQLPCEDTYCLTPPESECVGGNLRVYSPRGTCNDGLCDYESRDIACPSGSCANGACTEVPCTSVQCEMPPSAHCIDTETLRTYTTAGRCTVAGGNPKCVYDYKDTFCEYGCTDGSCIVHACSNVTCNKPPANYCDSDDLIAFLGTGYCNKGACRYLGRRIFCAGDCRDGTCEEDDLCLGILCNHPPAPYCADKSTLKSFAAEGTCTSGVCSYTSKSTACVGSCSNGRCSDDACAGVTCKTPPADYCLDDDTALQFIETGECLANGTCAYDSLEVICENGCYYGWCPN